MQRPEFTSLPEFVSGSQRQQASVPDSSGDRAGPSADRPPGVKLPPVSQGMLVTAARWLEGHYRPSAPPTAGRRGGTGGSGTMTQTDQLTVTLRRYSRTLQRLLTDTDIRTHEHNGHTDTDIRTRTYGHGHTDTDIRTRTYGHGHTDTDIRTRTLASLQKEAKLPWGQVSALNCLKLCLQNQILHDFFTGYTTVNFLLPPSRCYLSPPC